VADSSFERLRALATQLAGLRVDVIAASGNATISAHSTTRTEMYRRSAAFIDRILKGAKPADLPIEQPTKFGLMVNLKTARTLALTIPSSLLQRADQVIE